MRIAARLLYVLGATLLSGFVLVVTGGASSAFLQPLRNTVSLSYKRAMEFGGDMTIRDTLYKQSPILDSVPLSNVPKDEMNFEPGMRWQHWAIERMWEERQQMGYTPLVKFEHIPITLIVFKDESAARSENLKHRFAWALFFWAILEGHVRNGTTVYEASSGNTALSELYMAKLLKSPFITIIPDTTEPAKVKHIEQAGGKVIKVPLGEMQSAARDYAHRDENGFFMNQFGNADLAEEFHQSQHGDKLTKAHESSNIYYELFQQMNNTVPDYFVHSAATGGTLSSVGRFVKKYDLSTQVVLADPQFSLYYDYVIAGAFDGRKYSNLTASETSNLHDKWTPPGIAGTGFGPLWGLPIRGRTSSLAPSVVDRVLKVPDLASVAAMQLLSERYGISGGPSTGLNFITTLEVSAKARLDEADRRVESKDLTLATLICDKGKNYAPTYYSRSWINEHFKPHGGLPALDCWRGVIGEFLDEAASKAQISYSPINRGSERCGSTINRRLATK